MAEDQGRDTQRDWGAADSALGGYGTAGLFSRRRQMQRTTGGSYANLSDVTQGRAVGGSVNMPTTGPKPLETTPFFGQRQPASGPSAMAPGVAPNFNGKVPWTPNWGQSGALLSRVGRGAAVALGKALTKDSEEPAGEEPQVKQPTQQTPTSPQSAPDNTWAPPKASENLTYTTGNTPFTLENDPFVDEGTDELGRPLKNAPKSGSPWGAPTGAPKHGPIYTTEHGQEAPASPLAPPNPASRVTSTPTTRALGRTVQIDDIANQEQYPDTYDLAPPLTGRSGVAATRPDSLGRTVPGRPESSGRTLPNRPGGRRIAANPNPWFSGQGTEFAGGQPTPPTADSAGMTRREQVATSRPQSSGRTVAGRPQGNGRTVEGRPGSTPQPVVIDDIANQQQYPDTMSTLEAVAGTAPDGVRPDSSGRTVPGRPESSGRTVPGRPGGRRAAANPNPWFSGQGNTPAGAQPAPALTAESTGVTRRQEVAASRPQSSGLARSPFRPASVMQQRQEQDNQQRVEQAAASYENPTAGGVPTRMGVTTFWQDEDTLAKVDPEYQARKEEYDRGLEAGKYRRRGF